MSNHASKRTTAGGVDVCVTPTARRTYAWDNGAPEHWECGATIEATMPEAESMDWIESARLIVNPLLQSVTFSAFVRGATDPLNFTVRLSDAQAGSVRVVHPHPEVVWGQPTMRPMADPGVYDVIVVDRRVRKAVGQ
jgi:hypothetical protein